MVRNSSRIRNRFHRDGELRSGPGVGRRLADGTSCSCPCAPPLLTPTTTLTAANLHVCRPLIGWPSVSRIQQMNSQIHQDRLEHLYDRLQLPCPPHPPLYTAKKLAQAKLYVIHQNLCELEFRSRFNPSQRLGQGRYILTRGDPYPTFTCKPRTGNSLETSEFLEKHL